MADKQVIVEIVYDTEEAIKSLDKLTSAVEGEKIAQAKLKSEMEAGTISQKEYSVEVERSKQRAAAANTERKTTLQLISSEKGSVNELKANIKLLTAERDKLNQNTVAGRKAAGEYNAKLTEMKAALKEAQTESGKTQGAFAKFGSNLKSIPGPIGGIINGIMGMTRASLAFIATPIGAIIAAIGLALKALISYFKGSEEGQNRLNKIMMVFKTVAGNLSDIVQKLGKFLFEAFTKPKESLEKLVEFIKGQFLNRLQALANMGKAIGKIFSKDWKEGFIEFGKSFVDFETGVLNTVDKIRNGVKSITAEMETEIAIAKKLADRQAALDLLQRKFLVDRIKLESQISDLKEKAEDKINLTQEQQLDHFKEAQRLQDLILDTDMKIAKEKANIKKIQNSLSNSTKEDLDEQAQLEAEVFRVQKENSDKRKEMTTKIIALQQMMNAEIKKEGDEAEKAAEKDEKAQAEILKRRGEAIWKLAELKQQELELQAKTFEQQRDAAIKQADAEREHALEVQGLLQEEIELAEAEHKARLAAIEVEYQTNIKQQREQALQQSLTDMQAIIEATHGMADMRVTILSDAFAKIATINYKELKTASDVFVAIGQAASGLSGLVIKNYDREYNALAEQKEAELALVGDDAAAKEAIEKKFAQRELELKKKQFEEEKKKAIIDAGIATALAIVKGLASGLPMPGIAMAAFAAILGGIQIASIANQSYTPSTSFAKGGVIGGRSHAHGGTQFVGSDGSRFEAERGEAMFVMKKDATAEIAALSAINEAHGGRSFFDRSQARSYADGGEVAQASNIRQTINDEIARTPIFVKVGDIQTGMTDVENSKNVGVI
jgi:hypothetical protein